MQARDVMTRAVVTIRPETDIRQIASLLLENRISGVPVVDGSRSPVGMVTEADLLNSRPDRDKQRDWWLSLLAEDEVLGGEFLSAIRNDHRTARDVMSTPVVTVSEDTDIAQIGMLFTTLQIKRAPVTKDGYITGIVARADLIRAIASPQAENPQEQGTFGWTLRFEPFKSAETSTYHIKTQESPKEDGLNASLFRHLVSEDSLEKARQHDKQRQVAEEQRKAKMKELINHHPTDQHWRTVLHQARIAAENGERDMLLLQFPHELCSDGGRAINVAEPDWPATLTGEAAEAYLRFERDLRPNGFHLIAKVLSFPDGYIGDIGLFLYWSGATET
jgi:CBS domain-containing protein